MAHPPIDSQITFLYVDDLVQTARFYEDILGLSLKLDQRTCRIYQVSTDGYIGFCERSDDSQPNQDRTHVILTIVTSKVEEWYQRLAKRGIKMEKPPTNNPAFNIYHFFLRDPNGYLIEIQQFHHDF